ncbi:MAG: hypothetical protein AAGC88_17020, partial [Bacteroidota bacterium]
NFEHDKSKKYQVQSQMSFPTHTRGRRVAIDRDKPKNDEIKKDEPNDRKKPARSALVKNALH